MTAPKRILVIATREIGDVLRATPLIRSIKQRHPGAAIDVLAFRNKAGMLADTPAVTRYGPVKTGVTGELGPSAAQPRGDVRLRAVHAPCMRRECDDGGGNDVRPVCSAALPRAAVWAALLGQMRHPR